MSRTRLITLRLASQQLVTSTSNMDSPGPINDEVIADSEGEMDEDDRPENRGALIMLWLLSYVLLIYWILGI